MKRISTSTYLNMIVRHFKEIDLWGTKGKKREDGVSLWRAECSICIVLFGFALCDLQIFQTAFVL